MPNNFEDVTKAEPKTTEMATHKIASTQESSQSELADGIEYSGVITIKAPAQEIYNFWRDLSNLPKYMANLRSIEILSPRLSHWRWTAVKDKIEIDWNSEITKDIPGALIAWQTEAGSKVPQAGQVTFRELNFGRGTEARVTLKYHPPGGVVTDFMSKLIGESPQLIINDNLRRLKELIEVGVIPTIEGQSRGGDEETLNSQLHTHH